MTYKGMLLSALLVPVAITSYGKDSVDSRLQQLKEARYQKELELSELGAKIAEKYELLEDIFDEAVRFYRKYLKEEHLEGDKAREFALTLDAANDEVEIRLKSALANGNVREFFSKELFEDEVVSEDSLNAVRFFSIRLFFERNLLKTLVEGYENCLQQLVEIDGLLNK